MKPTALSTRVSDRQTGHTRSTRRPASGLTVLTLSVVLIGAGNLILTAGAQDWFGIDYLLLATGLCALLVLVRFKHLLDNLPVMAPVLLFLATCGVGFLSSQGTAYTASKAQTLLIVLVITAGLAAFPDRARVHRSIAVTLLVLGAVATIWLLIGGSVGVNGRTSLLDLNPIGVARLTGLTVVISLALLLMPSASRTRVRLRIAALLVLALCGLVATVLTGSRGPLLAVGAGVAVMLLVVMRRRRFGPVPIVLLAAFSVAGYAAVASYGGDGLGRLESGVDSGRGLLYEQTWDLIRQRPWTGIGWGNFPAYIFDFASDTGSLYPHNVLLEVWVEGGILALIGFVGLCVVALVRLTRASADQPWSLACLGLLVFALSSAQFSSDIVGNRLMWLMLCLAVLSSHRVRR